MTTELDKLHNDIMNIPLPEEFTRVLNENNARAYKLGHRDARHAAAELVSAFAGSNPATTFERTVYEILWEMRLAPRHQLEEAAKRIAEAIKP